MLALANMLFRIQILGCLWSRRLNGFPTVPALLYSWNPAPDLFPFHCHEGALTRSLWHSAHLLPVLFPLTFLLSHFLEDLWTRFRYYKLRQYKELKETNQPFSASSAHAYSGARIHSLDVTNKPSSGPEALTIRQSVQISQLLKSMFIFLKLFLDIQ